MSRITAVQTALVRVPLDNPTSFSTRQVLAREFVLVRVLCEDGHTGIGFTYGGSAAGSITAEAARVLFAPMLRGEDSFRVEGLWEAMYAEALLQGRTGAAMRAMSAIDIALWDHNARAVGLPLYKLLGGHARSAVKAYASGGYYLPGKTPGDLAEELKGYRAMGFGAVKIKVGRLGLADEEARIAAAREAIGDEGLLMLDCNNGWQDLQTALRYMAVFEPYQPYWIEEPFTPDDIDSHARLAERTSVPVATGEIESGRWRFKEILERRAAMILQPDAICCGGITEFRRITATAASFGVSVCPHAYHEMHLHLAASSPNVPFAECFTDDSIVNFRRLIDTQVELEAGALKLPTTPGLGFDYDEAAV
ncbi:MAG: mandelate racemase/muconate lactonizing enzyme family protein, partial [Gammaproteobacteria bacterium]|nr:mandelate racemase/muconate lactonizing enzyme family protein [Gammaproteobacteria bacterium]